MEETPELTHQCGNCCIGQKNALKALDNREFSRISARKVTKKLPKGSIIFSEGEYLNGVYCIKEGVCKLTKLSSNGKAQIIRFAKQGTILGNRSVISKEAVNLTAVTLGEVKACFIPKEEIYQVFAKNPQFSEEVIKDICLDLKKSDNIIVNMAQKTVKQRLCDALLYLENTFGKDAQGFINILLSREDIGNMIGTATESLIRMLSDFNKSKLIEVKGKRIRIINPKKLQRISEGHNA